MLVSLIPLLWREDVDAVWALHDSIPSASPIPKPRQRRRKRSVISVILSHVLGPESLSLTPTSFNMVGCGLSLVISVIKCSVAVTLPACSTPGMHPTPEPRPRR